MGNDREHLGAKTSLSQSLLRTPCQLQDKRLIVANFSICSPYSPLTKGRSCASICSSMPSCCMSSQSCAWLSKKTSQILWYYDACINGQDGLRLPSRQAVGSEQSQHLIFKSTLPPFEDLLKRTRFDDATETTSSRNERKQPIRAPTNRYNAPGQGFHYSEYSRNRRRISCEDQTAYEPLCWKDRSLGVAALLARKDNMWPRLTMAPKDTYPIPKVSQHHARFEIHSTSGSISAKAGSSV